MDHMQEAPPNVEVKRLEPEKLLGIHPKDESMFGNLPLKYLRTLASNAEMHIAPNGASLNTRDQSLLERLRAQNPTQTDYYLDEKLALLSSPRRASRLSGDGHTLPSLISSLQGNTLSRVHRRKANCFEYMLATQMLNISNRDSPGHLTLVPFRDLGGMSKLALDIHLGAVYVGPVRESLQSDHARHRQAALDNHTGRLTTYVAGQISSYPGLSEGDRMQKIDTTVTQLLQVSRKYERMSGPKESHRASHRDPTEDNARAYVVLFGSNFFDLEHIRELHRLDMKSRRDK